jgi:hypothetical protein
MYVFCGLRYSEALKNTNPVFNNYLQVSTLNFIVTVKNNLESILFRLELYKRTSVWRTEGGRKKFGEKIFSSAEKRRKRNSAAEFAEIY